MPGWSVDHIAKDCDDSLARSHARRKDFPPSPPSSGWLAVLFVIAVLLILTVLLMGGGVR